MIEQFRRFDTYPTWFGSQSTGSQATKHRGTADSGGKNQVPSSLVQKTLPKNIGRNNCVEKSAVTRKMRQPFLARVFGMSKNVFMQRLTQSFS